MVTIEHETRVVGVITDGGIDQPDQQKGTSESDGEKKLLLEFLRGVAELEPEPDSHQEGDGEDSKKNAHGRLGDVVWMVGFPVRTTDAGNAEDETDEADDKYQFG